MLKCSASVRTQTSLQRWHYDKVNPVLLAQGSKRGRQMGCVLCSVSCLYGLRREYLSLNSFGWEFLKWWPMHPLYFCLEFHPEKCGANWSLGMWAHFMIRISHGKFNFNPSQLNKQFLWSKHCGQTGIIKRGPLGLRSLQRNTQIYGKKSAHYRIYDKYKEPRKVREFGGELNLGEGLMGKEAVNSDDSTKEGFLPLRRSPL